MSRGKQRGRLGIRCPGCEKQLTGGVHMAGKTVKCPACGQEIQIRPLDAEDTWQDQGSVWTRNIFTGRREGKAGMPTLYAYLVMVVAAVVFALIAAVL